ncbi:MAG: hypothetical protein HWN68_02335 [Desulfobacterales bacterium]|nr:hypothetical protein [Desulfobacterales bacterium]
MKIEAGEYVNRLEESVNRMDDLDWQEHFLEKTRGNALYQKFIREGLTADVSAVNVQADALGVIHDLVIEAATNIAVADDIIWKIDVTEPLRRFFLAVRGSVWRISEGPPIQSPERFTPVDITLEYEWGQDALFSQSYIEDMPLAVLQRAIADCGQLLEEQLTTDIIALYDAIAEADLAGGANVDVAASGTLTWADLVNAWTTLKTEGFTADAAIIHPNEIADLWNDDKFINAFYFGDKADVARGVLGETYLGFKIVETDLMVDASDLVYLVDLDKAAVCTMRRDITTQPYEEKLYQGAISTRRYGLGTLRTEAICRLDVTP